MVRHGGCLGLGLAAMGTYRQDVYDQLRSNLYQDDAVTGEAAGIAMGMVMLGSKDKQAIQDMVTVSVHKKFPKSTHLIYFDNCQQLDQYHSILGFYEKMLKFNIR